jgi:VIT1/CCC1 family predicted Fe2+/Mn2+ transporter
MALLPAPRYSPARVAALENWVEEMQSAHLYRVLADVERDPPVREMFRGLAEAAEHQAGTWAAKLDSAAPPYRPSTRARIVATLVRALGPRRMVPVLAAMKVRGVSVYSAPNAPTGHEMPTTVSEIGHRHRTGGGNLRAAVFGVNDGLVSNTCLILGVAGAGAQPEVIVLSGLAGLLAGAFSMGAGEYVSVRSQRELFEYQIGLERAELEEYPEEEAEEIALIYQARGLELEEARALASRLMADPEHALDTLAREELGLNPAELGSPIGAAASSFAAFAAGALVPLAPVVLGVERAIPTTIALASLALFSVGCTLSLFTGRSTLWSGLRMLLIGGAAGAATWLVGSLLGVGMS